LKGQFPFSSQKCGELLDGGGGFLSTFPQLLLEIVTLRKASPKSVDNHKALLGWCEYLTSMLIWLHQIY
jgi:hypothetical protein